MAIKNAHPRDWQVILIAHNFRDEIDCNSGERRRVFLNGETKGMAKNFSKTKGK